MSEKDNEKNWLERMIGWVYSMAIGLLGLKKKDQNEK